MTVPFLSDFLDAPVLLLLRAIFGPPFQCMLSLLGRFAVSCVTDSLVASFRYEIRCRAFWIRAELEMLPMLKNPLDQHCSKAHYIGHKLTCLNRAPEWRRFL
jgi:hypothetical protein